MDGPGRAAVVRRLAALADAGRLGSGQVRSAAGALGVSERTVWRWVGQARAGEGWTAGRGGHFQVTGEVRQRLAFWRGNAAAVHRELADQGPPAPGLIPTEPGSMPASPMIKASTPARPPERGVGAPARPSPSPRSAPAQPGSRSSNSP